MTRRSPGGSSSQSCCGCYKRSMTLTWRAPRPSRRAVLPARHAKRWTKQGPRLGSLEALGEELHGVVEAAQEKPYEQEAVWRRRRQKGQGGLRPEQFEAVKRRPAPKESREPAR